MDDNDTKQVQGMIDKAIAFPTKKYGDTPTDDLQLTPKKYVDAKSGTAFGGLVKIDGSSTDLPPGWTSGTSSSGVYTVTHNLGTLGYGVSVSIVNSNTISIGNLTDVSANSFTVTWYNQTSAVSWTATNTAFSFVLSLS